MFDENWFDETFYDLKLHKPVKGSDLLDTEQVGAKGIPIIRAGFLRLAACQQNWKYSQKPMSYSIKVREWRITTPKIDGPVLNYTKNQYPILETNPVNYISIFKQNRILFAGFYTPFLDPNVHYNSLDIYEKSSVNPLRKLIKEIHKTRLLEGFEISLFNLIERAQYNKGRPTVGKDGKIIQPSGQHKSNV